MTQEIDISGHTTDSSLREKVLEHLFIGELLKCMWCKGMRSVEVLRAEVDRGGYDLLLEYGGIMRHVQLKASRNNGTRTDVDVSLNLAAKPSGCVIWIWFDPDTLQLSRFLWLGGKAGEKLPPLGDKIAKHSKGNSSGLKAERPNIRLVRKNKFTTFAKIEELAEALFSPHQSGVRSPKE